jgi:predicted Zn-dependent peptidase
MSAETRNGITGTTLEGLRVLTESFPMFHSVALGVVFNQGSRDETRGELGLTHLIEHMLFKGTRQQTAAQLSRAIESVGGTINGFTNKETTGISTWCPAEHFERTSALVLEILNESQFAPAELAKEREVVTEEIKSSRDDPEERVADLLFEATYGDHGLGSPMGGLPETVAGFGDDQIRSFYRRNYVRPKAVVAAVGDVDHDRLVQRFGAGLTLGSQAPDCARRPPSLNPPGIKVFERNEITQVFLCVAKPTIAYPDPRRCALAVMNSAFGGATSARLFLRLREDEGLVYEVSSSAELFSDAGVLAVFLVTDKKKLGRSLAVLHQEWDRLVQENLTADEFETARNYTKGMILLSMEGLSGRLRRLVVNQLLLDRVVTMEEMLAALDKLTRDDIAELLSELGRFENYYISAVGPIDEQELRSLL